MGLAFGMSHLVGVLDVLFHFVGCFVSAIVGLRAGYTNLTKGPELA
jgi:hypothetical protein